MVRSASPRRNKPTTPGPSWRPSSLAHPASLRRRRRLMGPRKGLGRTGTGKSTLLETLADQDVHHGRGFAFVDPHGGVAELLATPQPRAAIARTAYADATDLSI